MALKNNLDTAFFHNNIYPFMTYCRMECEHDDYAGLSGDMNISTKNDKVVVNIKIAQLSVKVVFYLHGTTLYNGHQVSGWESALVEFGQDLKELAEDL